MGDESFRNQYLLSLLGHSAVTNFELKITLKKLFLWGFHYIIEILYSFHQSIVVNQVFCHCQAHCLKSFAKLISGFNYKIDKMSGDLVLTFVKNNTSYLHCLATL